MNNGLRVRAPDITDTPSPTETPLPTDFIRPVITVLSYVPSTTPPLFPGQEFDFAITLQNTGQVIAKNVIVVFPAGDVVPRNTGGTRTIGDLVPGATASFSQPLRVVSSLGGYEAVITVQVSYTDQYGNPYTETSVLSFEAGQYVDTPTPTATLSVRPQLVIESSTTTPATLAPGTMFRLDVALVNVSGEAARQVVVTILASTSGTGETTTTTSSTTGDLSPVNGSNVRYVDQMAAGERITLSYDLAVAGDAAGGLVPVDVALSYIDNFNVQHDETAAISLAVESPAFFQVNLFEALPDLIQVGDLFEIPVEVINIGEDSVNVNTVEVTSDNRLRISEGSLYVGPLDGGTSATLIAQAEALQAGTAEVEIHINYLDAFQQPREYIETLSIEIEAVPLDVGPDEGEDGTSEEDGELTLVERLWRALLGFLGLGTRPAEESLPVPPGSTPVPSGEGDSE